MRVTQRTMYNSAVSNMNNTLSAYMESNMQGATMKQLNRPSDDPAGMARVLMYRSSIGDLSQYQRNLNTAEGWLKTADNTLTLGDSGVTSVLTQIMGKAEQAATSTMSAENRAQIAESVRELFGTLLNQSNTRFEGKSIFAGLNYDGTAFVEGLAADCESPDFKEDLEGALQAGDWIKFDGPMPKSAIVRFPTGGVVPPPAGGGPLDYEYTTDAGKTWVKGQVAEGSQLIDIGGATMTLPVNPATGQTRVPAFDADNTSASQITVRPTAMYQGADNNSSHQVIPRGMPAGTQISGVSGSFSSDIEVRYDTAVDMAAPNQPFSYSYSADGGRTWTQRQGNTNDPRLVVPGGYITVASPGPGNTQVAAGASMTLKPMRTALDVQSDGDYMAQMSNVGKDIFGGQYYSLTPSGQKVLKTAYDGEGENVFESVGKLIGALETNNQAGCQEALENLKKSLQTITTQGARIGGRVDALAVTKESLLTNKDDQSSSMSAIQDIDLTTLLTNLTQQQLAYNTVLKSSSMIMQLNLTQFV